MALYQPYINGKKKFKPVDEVTMERYKTYFSNITFRKIKKKVFYMRGKGPNGAA